MTLAVQIWCVNAACCLHWRHWDERYFLFNATSGQTHILTEIGAQVLISLQHKALDIPQLTVEIISQYPVMEADDALTYQLEVTLEEMYRLGLIEPRSE